MRRPIPSEPPFMPMAFISVTAVLIQLGSKWGQVLFYVSSKLAQKLEKQPYFNRNTVVLWQAAPIKISTVFLVFSMVSAFWARFLELAASYCWLLLCNQKRYCGFYGIWCGLHDSVSDLHFDGFPVLRGSGHKSACSAQRG